MEQKSQSKPLGRFTHALQRVGEAGQKISRSPSLLILFRRVHQNGVSLCGAPFLMFRPGPILGESRFLREIHGGSGAKDAQFTPVIGGGKDIALELQYLAGGVEGIWQTIQFVVSLCGTAKFEPAMATAQNICHRALKSCSNPHDTSIAWEVPNRRPCGFLERKP